MGHLRFLHERPVGFRESWVLPLFPGKHVAAERLSSYRQSEKDHPGRDDQCICSRVSAGGDNAASRGAVAKNRNLLRLMASETFWHIGFQEGEVFDPRIFCIATAHMNTRGGKSGIFQARIKSWHFVRECFSVIWARILACSPRLRRHPVNSQNSTTRTRLHICSK